MCGSVSRVVVLQHPQTKQTVECRVDPSGDLLGQRHERDRQHESHHPLPSSALAARRTLIGLSASQLRICQLFGSPILWTRAWIIRPPVVLYGGRITSHSPVSSARRSPTWSSVGRILGSAAACGLRFFSEGDLAIRLVSRRRPRGT